MGSSTVRETFDALASEYDALKLRLIPGYREIQGLVDRYAGLRSELDARVLELGMGTGQWAERLLESHPRAELDGVDFSAQMREVSDARLRRFQERIRIHDLDLDEGLPDGPFDLVVSFFAIHHVSDKGRLLHRLSERLTPGGRLLYADITLAPTSGLERLYLDGWVDFMRSAGLEKEEIDRVLQDHRENDQPETIERQLTYMRLAGFDPAILLWSREKFALFFGQR